MLNWLFDIIFKERVEALVEQKFKEKVIERYFASKQAELQQRIQRLRKTLHSQTPRIQEDKPSEVLSSNNVQTRSDKSRVSPEASKAQLVKRNELDSIKAKLMGENNV